jgi:hypothetical protein
VVSAGEALVLASELAAALAQIAKLQCVLCKKTLENEIFKEAMGQKDLEGLHLSPRHAPLGAQGFRISAIPNNLKTNIIIVVLFLSALKKA